MIHQRGSEFLKKDAKGSILLYSVILLVVAGILIMSVTGLVTWNLRTAFRNESRLQAFYAAETGVQHVLTWFNDPDTSPDPIYFMPNSEDTWLDPVTYGSIIVSDKSFTGNSVWLPDLDWMDRNFQLGEVTSIEITPPAAGDPAGTVCRVISTGRANQVETTVEVALLTNHIPAITAPAALVAKAGGAISNGNFLVNWGEVWAREDIELLNPIDKKFPDEASDPWFAARTEGYLVQDKSSGLFADGRIDGGFGSVPPASTDPNYVQPFLESVLSPKNQKLKGHENLYQQEPIDWPAYQYENMKKIALARGFKYFRTTPDGGNDGDHLIIGYNPDGTPVTKSFTEVFNLAPQTASDVDPNDIPEIIFIDTFDGKPPAADGSNMPDLKIAGNSPFLNGVFFIAGNLDWNGTGNSGPLNDPLKPDGTIDNQALQNVRLYGMTYTYGTTNFSGNGTGYGSAFSEKGFTGGGTWHQYYDARLADPDRNRITSKLLVRLFNTY